MGGQVISDVLLLFDISSRIYCVASLGSFVSRFGAICYTWVTERCQCVSNKLGPLMKVHLFR